jgi:hypothetical protein
MFHTWLPFLLSALLWSLLFYVLWDISMWLRKVKRTMQRNFAIPCHRCRYANPDYHHLKCAVQPRIAFSEEAIQCHDFRTQESNTVLR